MSASATMGARIAADADDRTLTRTHWIALVLILLAALLPGFFSIPTMDRDEARYSQASVQMMETGDYVDIRFQDQPRHVKPVGIYWMQVASAAPFGGADAPTWAFRIPSLFGVLIGALATAWIGARIAGRNVGLTAGVLVGVCLMSAVEARTAKTDAMLFASAAIAQAALYVILVESRNEKQLKFVGAPLVFWAASGAALLIKGPIVAMVSALTLIGYRILARDRHILSRLNPLRGLLVAGAIFLPWFIAIVIQTNGAYIEKSVGHALLGKVAESDDSHAGPFGYHTLLLPLTFWPGSLLLGLAGLAAWRARRTAYGMFLLAWLLPSWLVFEFVHTKLPHYVFPMFPALAILAALGVTKAASLLKRARGRIIHTVAVMFFVVMTAILGFAPVVFAELVGGEFSTGALIASLAAALVIMGAGVFFAITRQERAVAVLGAGVFALYVANFEASLPRLDALWPSHRAHEAAIANITCTDPSFATAGYYEPSNVFHFGTDTRLTDGAGAAQFMIEGGPCAVAVVEGREEEAFTAALDAAGLTVQALDTVIGHNAVKGDDLTLTIYAKP